MGHKVTGWFLRTTNERLASYTKVLDGDDACWVWIGARAGENGVLRIDGVRTYVARFVLERAIGPLPTGQVPLHRCGNRSCVRPEHLYAGPRSAARTRGRSSFEGRVEHARGRLNALTRWEGGCRVWIGPRFPSGYGTLVFTTDSGKLEQRAHRVAWVLARGPIPDSMQVLHHCDNPPCVNVRHLFLGTETDNVIDKCAKGRAMTVVGEKNSMSKFTDAEVRKIRELSASGLSSYAVAAECLTQGLRVSARHVRDLVAAGDGVRRVPIRQRGRYAANGIGLKPPGSRGLPKRPPGGRA